MKEKIVNGNELFEKTKNEIKKANIEMVLILLGIIVISIVVTISGTPLALIVTIPAFLWISYLCFKMNTSFKSKIENLKTNSQEINTYCVDYGKGLYVTKKSIIYINAFNSKFVYVQLNDIKSLDIITTENSKDIRIKAKNGKVFIIPSNDKVIDLIKEGKNIKKEGKLIKSDLVKDFYLYDNYAEGCIDFPALGKSCNNYFSNGNEETIKYAEEIAKYVKTFKYEDFKEALTSTVWAYNYYLKEFPGYDDIIKANMPVRINEKEILKFMSLSSIFLEDLKDNSIGLIIGFEVPWEVEHGFSWVYKGKELIYVGSGQDISGDSKEDLLKGNWNFAKKYHSEVKLTPEDYNMIEENFKKQS